MERQTPDFIVASRAAIAQAGELAVQYSFSILGAILLLVLGWLLARLLHRWSLAGMSKIRHFDVTLAHFIANMVRYVVLVFVLVTVLGQFGVQTASIIAALGAAGLAVGLALQGTLQNIAAGIMLLVLRPFRVGETIETKDVSGTIQEIGLFATEIRTADGLFQLAPNATLWNTPVKNFSRLPTRRSDITVVLPLNANIREVETMLQSIAARDGRVMDDPAPITLLSAMTDETVSVTLRVWTKTGDFAAASRDLTKAAKISFDKVRDIASASEARQSPSLAAE